jgi:hypothetical protein
MHSVATPSLPCGLDTQPKARHHPRGFALQKETPACHWAGFLPILHPIKVLPTVLLVTTILAVRGCWSCVSEPVSTHRLTPGGGYFNHAEAVAVCPAVAAACELLAKCCKGCTQSQAPEQRQHLA